MPQYSNIPQYQQYLNLQKYPNILQNNICKMQNQNNLDQNILSNNLNSVNFQNILSNNSNLLQNFNNYLNLKSNLNNQKQLNQNQIYLNQNNLYFNNNSGIPNDIFQHHHISNENLKTTQNDSLKGFFLNSKLLCNLSSHNNNFYLNEANFNSAYKIENKNNQDLQFNLLNEMAEK